MGSMMGDPPALYLTLKKLNIVTGKIGPNEVYGWFATCDQSAINFLQWFQDNISQENVLTYAETIACKELKDKNLFLEEAQCENALKKVNPEMFNMEDNEFDCEMLRNEEAMYQEQLESYETSIKLYEQKNRKLKKQKYYYANELSAAEFKASETAAMCLDIAEQVDAVNGKISKAMTSLSKSNNGQGLTKTFLDLDFNWIDAPLSKVKFLIEKFTSQDKENTENDKQMSLDENIHKILLERASLALKTRINNSIELQVACAKLQFLSELADNKTTSVNLKNLNTSSSTSCILLKRTQLQTAIMRHVEQYTNKWQEVIEHKQFLEINLKTRQSLKLQQHLTHAAKLQMVLHKLCTVAYNDLERRKALNKSLHDYVNHELQPCALRTHTMQLLIAEQDKFNKAPEEHYPALKKIHEIIMFPEEMGTNVTFQDCVNSIITFEDKCNALEEKVFIRDIDKAVTDLKKLENENRTLRAFLTSQGTRLLTSIPFVTYDALINADLCMEEQDKKLKYIANLPKEITPGNNKWLKYKRQLWMYFLVKPERMEAIIEALEKEVQQQRTKYLSKNQKN